MKFLKNITFINQEGNKTDIELEVGENVKLSLNASLENVEYDLINGKLVVSFYVEQSLINPPAR